MNHPTCREANREFDEAYTFQRVLPDGRRIIIYSEHTDRMGRNVRHWLCIQDRIDAPSIWTVGGQRYLERDGTWQEPRGARFRRHFGSVKAAIRHAEAVNPPEMAPECVFA